MENLPLYLLGFLGQALFGGRLLTQWWQSEKSGRVVSPSIYWYLSISGSYLFLLYGIMRGDLIIVFGQLASYFIYVRNLQLKNAWRETALLLRALILILPPVTIAICMFAGFLAVSAFSISAFTSPIMLIGTIGQLGLNLRFLYQWYASEKSGDSILPFGFWSISTGCSILVIFYSLFHPIYGIEPVLLISQTLGILIYVRNMVLARRLMVNV